MQHSKEQEAWEKEFDEWFFTIVDAEKSDWTKLQANKIRWHVKGKIRNLLSSHEQSLRQSISEEIEKEADKWKSGSHHTNIAGGAIAGLSVASKIARGTYE